MENASVGLIGLVIALITSVVGAFAYLMGEIRKVANACKRDNEELRDSFNTRFDGFARQEYAERASLRNEFAAITSRIEQEIRRMAETAVRRDDVTQIEARVTRAVEKVEQKQDEMSAKMTQFLVSGSTRREGERG